MPISDHPVYGSFHRLWSLAARQDGYNKEDWKLVQKAVEDHCRSERLSHKELHEALGIPYVK